jgi:nitronate monooxygenase
VATLPRRFTDLVGCRVPLQLAPMAGMVTPDLARAVAGAGALAMVSGTTGPPEGLAPLLDDIGATGAVGVNFIEPFLDLAALDGLAGHTRVVECFFGTPSSATVARMTAGGAIAGWQVGSAEEARLAVDAGCSYVVAQGVEAGGHVKGITGLLPLLDAVLDAVDVPVVAAGGIGTPRSVDAVFAAGADAVRIGTRFLAAAETSIHPRYLEALVAAGPADTVLTEKFCVMWPDAPHRVLRSAVEAAEALDGDVAGEFPLGETMIPLARWAALPPSAEVTGHIEGMALYAGQSVGAVRRVQPATEIIAELLSLPTT